MRRELRLKAVEIFDDTSRFTPPTLPPDPPVEHQECLQSTSCAAGKPADQVPPRPGVSCHARLLLASTGRGEDGTEGRRATGKKKKHDRNRKFIEGRVAFLSFSSRLESGDTTQESRVDKISQGTIKVISVIGQLSSFKVLYPAVQQQDQTIPKKILLRKGTKSMAR